MNSLMSTVEAEKLAGLIFAITTEMASKNPVAEELFEGLFWFESQRNVRIARILFISESDQPGDTLGRKIFDEYVMFQLSKTRSIQRWWIRDVQERQLATAQHLGLSPL